ncbi:MAG: M4 family metallopeptidase [Candidatus Sumerlaeaceae bacterium]
MMKVMQRILVGPKTFSAIFAGLCFVSVYAASVPPETKAVEAGKSLLAQGGPHAQISYHRETGKIRFFGTQTGMGILTPRAQSLAGSGASAEETARAFIQDYAAAYGIHDAQRELRVMRSRALPGGRNVVRFQQLYQGLPVIGGEIIVHQNERRAVTATIGELQPDLDVDTQPTVSAEDAERTAKTLCAKLYGVPEGSLVASSPQLSIYSPALMDDKKIVRSPALVWQMEVSGSSEPPVREYVLVEAKTGRIALHFSKIYRSKQRQVYDCNHSSALPGTLVRQEGQPPSSIADANSAYDATGATYDFYANVLGRDSIDGAGMALISAVRYCPSSSECPYQNAFWDGAEMVFGDEMTADDVCAHELTHGVTEHESGLFYYMQSGAINEAMSDIFGEFVDLSDGLGNDSPSVRWKIGEDLPTSIGVIRDMANPPDYGQPDTTTNSLYYCGLWDNGGVHTNSGIANKCAFLMTDGSSFNGYNVEPLGLAKTARIWYEVNCNYLTSAADYQDLGDALVQAALSLVGTTVYGGETITLADVQQVKNAVDAVGMEIPPADCPATDAAICPDFDRQPFDLFYDDLENPSKGLWAKGYAVGGSYFYYPQNPNLWGFDATYATSGHTNFFGADVSNKSDSWIAMTQSVALPTTAPAIYMHFNHAYDFDPPYYDGGVVEYSTDNGITWNDAGSLIEENGYTNTISTSFENPLGGRRAFCGRSNGYISTRLNLTPLKGQSVRFRFRMGTDTSVGELGWFIDDIRIYLCGYRVETVSTDALTTPTGWFEFMRVPQSGGASTDFDDSVGAIRAWVASDAARYRIVGWLANRQNWLPYYYVGPNNFARGKFYVYATGQSNPSQLNSIPNFRLRLANRFAVNSMLEVLPHSSATSGDESISLELRPSTDPTRPSLYRVDFAPVNVPWLEQNPFTEGITRGFEIYALDPQDNGYVCLAESSIGVYPKSAVSVAGSNLMWLATYAPTNSDAGDLNPNKSGATLEKFSLLMPSTAGEFPARDNSVAPNVSAGPWGVTIDSTAFDNQGGSRVGVVQIDFSPDVATGQHVRIEPNKQYMVRYHVTSTQQSSLNPQLRLRVRTVRFAWTQKYEVGGAWAIATPEHSTLAAQALPGIGCANPDKVGGEAGGWYTVLVHSPLNLDIRPDMGGPLSSRMPNLSSQPGPGEPGTSLRDLKVAFDLIDTMSPSINAPLEAGNFTVDRIEVFSFDQIPD